MKATNTRNTVRIKAQKDAERLLKELVGKALQTEDIVDLFCDSYLRVYMNGMSEIRNSVEVSTPDLPPVLREIYRDSFRREISHLTGRNPTYTDAWELPIWTWA